MWYSSRSLTSESVEGTSLPLEGIDDIHGSDSLPLGVLGVGDSISDDVLQEHLHKINPTEAWIGMSVEIYLQDAPRLLIDETTNPLDSTSSSQSSDSWLGNALNKFKLVHVHNSLEYCRLPECYPSGLCDASWHRPYPSPFLLCHVQSWW